jgi:hypothetical protein
MTFGGNIEQLPPTVAGIIARSPLEPNASQSSRQPTVLFDFQARIMRHFPSTQPNFSIEFQSSSRREQRASQREIRESLHLEVTEGVRTNEACPHKLEVEKTQEYLVSFIVKSSFRGGKPTDTVFLAQAAECRGCR